MSVSKAEVEPNFYLSICTHSTSTLFSTEQEHDYAESESTNSLVLIVAVLVGVLGTVAIGLIIAVIIFSRRRSTSATGESLVVSEE